MVFCFFSLLLLLFCVGWWFFVCVCVWLFRVCVGWLVGFVAFFVWLGGLF